MHHQLEEAARNDCDVATRLKYGHSLEDIIASLVHTKHVLMKEVADLWMICPHKTIVNGKVLIWRCPDDLVPEREGPE